MINRGLTNKSQYIFNSKTGMLEKKEENKQTIESLSKQSRKKVINQSEIAQKANEKNDKTPLNQITVITKDDNLIHNYFFGFEHSWDSVNCLSIATMKMPRMNDENVNYWATYQGTVTVYAGCNFTFDKVNNNSYNTEQEAANSLAQYREDADIIPFFRGTVARIKEYQKYIIIYLNSIGVRFKQKIPDDFRQAYINGQNVRDAFQAICEFIGVQYICPPQQVAETTDENGMNNLPSTDGTENDVTQQQNTANQLANNATQQAEQSLSSSSSSSPSSSSSSSSNSNQQGILSNDNTQNDNQTGTENTEEQQGNQAIDDIQLNGYADINFDANGAITHGTTVIETSPDMAQTLLNMEESPLERYIEDETGIVEKVQNFLDGDMFEEIHNNVMDYNAITIEPKSTTSTDVSTSGNPSDPNSNTTGGSNDSKSQNNSSSNGSSSNNYSTNSKSINGSIKNGWINGQYYVNGRIYLSKDYINSLSPEQARQKRTQSYSNNTYTDDTMKKLLWRSLGRVLK